MLLEKSDFNDNSGLLCILVHHVVGAKPNKKVFRFI